MVDSFWNGFGLGGGQPLAAGADAKGGIARLGTPRASNLPGSTSPSPLVPAMSSMPAPASSGAEIKGLVRELASAPPVDAARVADLKAKIAIGAYRPDPGRIADAMIASEAASKSST